MGATEWKQRAGLSGRPLSSAFHVLAARPVVHRPPTTALGHFYRLGEGRGPTNRSSRRAEFQDRRESRPKCRLPVVTTRPRPLGRIRTRAHELTRRSLIRFRCRVRLASGDCESAVSAFSVSQLTAYITSRPTHVSYLYVNRYEYTYGTDIDRYLLRVWAIRISVGSLGKTETCKSRIIGT